MQIYLDIVFVLNSAVNYLLLCAAARLCGAYPRRRRLICAAILGGIYACATFLPGFGFLGRPLWRCVALAAMLYLAFGLRLLAPGGIFLALSLAMGGLVLLLGGALGAPVWLLDGRVYYSLGFPTLVLTAGAVYLGVWLLWQGAACHMGGTIPAKLRLGGMETDLTVLRDTGNTLRDPFTGRPVPVVEGQVIERLLPGASLRRDAVAGMQELRRRAPGLKTRLIPYRSVGTNNALLLAVRCDSLRIGKQERRDVYVAISPTRISEHGQYEGLIGEGE